MPTNLRQTVVNVLKTSVGCVLFALSFNLFLEPNGLNAGGISGLAMAVVHLLDFGTVGLITAVINLPLFAIGGMKIGRKFFFGSLFGMMLTAALLDLFSTLNPIRIDPLMAALYGGALSGLGLGLVFTSGMTTGGSDILVRLLKLKWRDVPLGTITILLDLVVVVITGIVYRDVSSALYCGVTIYIVGQVVDAVVYRFDYSKVALIISQNHEDVATQIWRQLNRGVTFLDGEGSYSGRPTKVVLTAVKRQQVALLKQLVTQIDPDAFVIVQDAHQVLGDGFSQYSKDAL